MASAPPPRGPRKGPRNPGPRPDGPPRGPPGPKPSGKGRGRPGGPPRKGRKPSGRRPKPEPDPAYEELLDDVPESEDAEPGDEGALDEDDPFKPRAEEPEAEAPQGLESKHADHMELLASSKVIATPAVWMLGVMDLLVVGAGFVLLAAMFSSPGIAFYLGIGGVFALLMGGVVLLALAKGRSRFAAACQESEFNVTRQAKPARVTYGELVHGHLDATACVFPDGLRVTIRDRPSPGFDTVRKVLIEGADTQSFSARATRRGAQVWDAIDVLMKDPGGMWRHTRSYAVPATVEVDPGMASLTLRNMLNSRTAFPDHAPKALVNLFRDIEHEHVRDYQGGDRMKDVDWKRMSATGQMLVKDRIVESLDVGLLLIDAGTSMQVAHKGRRNLDHALESASEIIQEAGRRNHQIGVLAFDDERVIEEMPPTRSRMLFHNSQEAFQRVAARHHEDHTKSKEPVAVSLQRALRGMVGSRMGVLLFTDLETIDEGIIQVMSRLGGDGAKVGVLVLPPPPFAAKKAAFHRHGMRPAAGKYRGRGHSKELREVLSVQGIETMDLPVDA